MIRDKKNMLFFKKGIFWTNMLFYYRNMLLIYQNMLFFFENTKICTYIPKIIKKAYLTHLWL